MQSTNTSRNSEEASTRRSRRPRAARACDLCRAKKNKCDEAAPCAYCRTRNVECLYQGQAVSDSSVARQYVQQLEERVRRLTTRVEAYENASVSPGEATNLHGPTSVDARDSSVANPHNPSVSATGASSLDPVGGLLHEGSHVEPPTPNSVSPWAVREQEVTGVNAHTRSTEFYGSSSSMARLSHLHGHQEPEQVSTGALLSALHNPGFRPVDLNARPNSGTEETSARNWYPRCRGFIDTFFTSIHYIHPILDKRLFLDDCEALWSGHAAAQPGIATFEPLYFSVLSLGAIVGVRDDEPIDGIDNLEWSRKFFQIAKSCCTRLGMVTDLNITQCYFIMAKVCQNELDPHASYMYIGLAVRTALATGINREPSPGTNKPASVLKAEARLWWGLYSLETETSFAMGRPDTLGADLYHNRRFPITESLQPGDGRDIALLDHPHCAIIKCMVDLSRITKGICVRIYLPQVNLAAAVALARELEEQLERWVTSLPEAIRPSAISGQNIGLRRARDLQWMKRQTLVLTLRYHNLRILLFGAYLLNSTPHERKSISGSREGVLKCLESAKQTVHLIHQTYQHSDFFRTWFYNVTYTVFAASGIFMYLRQEAEATEVDELLRMIDMAVEILDIMDESVVAQQVAKLLREAKLQFINGSQARDEALAGQLSPGATAFATSHWGSLNFFDGGLDPVFAASIGAFDMENPALGSYQQQAGLSNIWGA